MELEGIILSELSQTEKDKYDKISLFVGSRKKEPHTPPKQKQKQSHWLPEVGWRLGEGHMGERGQKVQTSSYKINKYSGCKVQHGDYSY